MGQGSRMSVGWWHLPVRTRNALQTEASEISVHVVSEEYGLEIEIEDNGGGFSEAQLAFPFTPKGARVTLSIPRKLT